MPKLRGHHLICLHFFHGEGYDAAFIENLGNVLRRAQRSPVSVTSGADDVCGACPHRNNDSCRYSEHSDEEIKEMDRRALDLLHIALDSQVSWAEVRRRMPAIFRLWHDSYCVVCGWKKACEKNDSYHELSASARITVD